MSERPVSSSDMDELRRPATRPRRTARRTRCRHGSGPDARRSDDENRPPAERDRRARASERRPLSHRARSCSRLLISLPVGSSRSEKIVDARSSFGSGSRPTCTARSPRPPGDRTRRGRARSGRFDAATMSPARHLLVAVGHEAHRGLAAARPGVDDPLPRHRDRVAVARAGRAERVAEVVLVRRRRRRAPGRRSRPVHAASSASNAGPFSSHSASSSPVATPARLSTCACVHGSVATPSSRPFTTSSGTPTRCARTSCTRQPGVAGAGRRSADASAAVITSADAGRATRGTRVA